MRLITYRRDATTGPALLKDGHVFPLNPLGYSDTQSFIAAGPKRWTGVNLQLEETGLNLLAPLSSVTLEAPTAAAFQDSLHRPQLSRPRRGVQDGAAQVSHRVYQVPAYADR